MKKVLLFLLTFVTAGLFAQGFNYKALLTDNSNQVLDNHNVQLRFTIKDGATDVWIETHSATTDANGIVKVVIGEGTRTGGTATNFDDIDWTNTSLTLKVEVDTGSGWETLVNNEALKFVPYAKYAEAGGSVHAINDLNDASTLNGNLFMGTGAGASITSASYNTGLGYWSLHSLTNGTGNTALGRRALQNAQSGSYNTAVGYSSGFSNTGSNNVFIGHSSGYYNTGSGNVFIGSNSGRDATGSNKLYIANSNTNSPLIYGEFDHNRVKINDKLFVGHSSSFTSNNLLRVVDASSNTMELVEIESEHPASTVDLLQLNFANAPTSGDSQFIEADLGSQTVFRVNHNGDIQTRGEYHTFSTGFANMVPIAYAYIHSDGSIAASSGNVSVTKESAGVYKINITGVNDLSYNNTIVLATPGANAITVFIRAYVDLTSHSVYVKTQESDGSQADKNFHVVIFKL